MNFITDFEVMRLICTHKNRYIPWIGAGFSAEARVKTAQQICEDIREDLLVSHEIDRNAISEAEQWAKENLDWDQPGKRYLTCIKKKYPNEAMRNDFFHDLLVNSQPSFSHYALALLMSNGFFKPICFTTNFDHLLENAFTQQEIGGVQVIRTDSECRFLQSTSGRYYIVKLHGDIDTQNVANTWDETLQLSEQMISVIKLNSPNSGLVVLGTAGNESSVSDIFADIRANAKKDNSAWSFGVLWGVYMGNKKPLKNLSETQLGKLIEERVKETGINDLIVQFSKSAPDQRFSFFPIWGAGRFMFDLALRTRNNELVNMASRYLDHEMRLRYIYTNAGLTDIAVEKHLENLRAERAKLNAAGPQPPQQTEVVLRAVNKQSNIEIRVTYGDITSHIQMADPEFERDIRAIVSPEDTCIGAGGGVAYRLLVKAGEKILLNELSKFSPIDQDSVAITSGGKLPVHYIIHAATLKIQSDASYAVNASNVKKTTAEILRKLAALKIGVVWTPLMGAGAASLNPSKSLQAIFEAILEFEQTNYKTLHNPVKIIIVIYREKHLSRTAIQRIFNKILGPKFNKLALPTT